jgi:16S rRNA (cytosine1402-N4)-methyltransferase
VDGLFADFGISNFHLQDAQRGFSFKKDARLDMRMDKTENLTAYDVVNAYSKETLSNIIKKYGEERFADRIANHIVKERALRKIGSTLELADIIKKAIPAKFHKQGFHPATKTFQAIRIYINKELEEIESLMKKLERYVKVKGRVAFISFHSLEDRLVKEALSYFAKSCICPPELPKCMCSKKQTFKILTKKPITPTENEIKTNPLARSAKLRAAEKIV